MPTIFVWRGVRIRRALLLGLIMLAALAAFEMFNFSTTEYALATFFGARYDALGIASWATLLAIAFCGIDFAGLARLFTPETQWHKEAKEIRLVTGAWFLGAIFNAGLTWWAVVTALTENPVLGNELVSREQVLQIVPLFVAALVWLTRILLIGTIAGAGDRFLNQQAGSPGGAVPRSQPRTAIGGGSRAPMPGQTLPAWSNRSVPAQPPTQARAADERESAPRRYDPPARPPVPAPGWPTGRASTVNTLRRDPPAFTPQARAGTSASGELSYEDVE